MEVWKGWMAASEPAKTSAFTWEQWVAHQAHRLASAKCSSEGSPLSDRQLARLSFVRWLCHTGRLDPAGHNPV